MKLHIECLQEKLDQILKDNDTLAITNEKIKDDLKKEMDSLTKHVKKLESDVAKNQKTLKQTEMAKDQALKELK